MVNISFRTSIYGLNIHIDLFKIHLDIRLHSKRKYEHTVGVGNTTEDGKRIIFFEYDDALLKHIKSEIRYLQEKHKFSDFYIFESSQKEGGYHAICLDKLSLHEFTALLHETSCDIGYKRLPLKTDGRTWVLRFMPKKESRKPKHIHTMKGVSDRREKSKAHALFLHYNYGLKTKKLKNIDNFTKVTLTTYATLNYMK